MAKLKNIIQQLAENDYLAIHENLSETGADKSAYLLKSMREKQMSENKLMKELKVSSNAYYTLRSRLNQKIEEYLLGQMESSRTNILKKVANIHEIAFVKKKVISIATLKKLEKDLIEYNLSNELTIIYKALKKLHINSDQYKEYSQLYDLHLSKMCELDKLEFVLAEYFALYGIYCLTGADKEKKALIKINNELDKIPKESTNHRFYVYKSCVNVFHRLFVINEEEQMNDISESIEDILIQLEEIIEQFPLDSVYHHLRLVWEYLKLEYYNHYGIYRKAEEHFQRVNEDCFKMLSNYSGFTYPPQFLITKIKRSQRNEMTLQLEEENESIFQDYKSDVSDIPKYLTYVVYRSISCFYAKKYDVAARWINKFLNEISLRNYPYALVEIKTILALQYCAMNEYDLFNQLISSIQRQIRILEKVDLNHILIFIKIMKVSINDMKKNKNIKLEKLGEKIKYSTVPHFSPTLLIKIDEDFIKRMSKF